MRSTSSAVALFGLALLAGPMSFGQEFIDVEAERERAAAAAAAGGAAAVAPATRQGGAISYGLDSAPATTTSLPPPTLPQRGNEDVGNLFLQLQQLQQDVLRLNGIVEEQAYEIRTLKEQSLERYMDIDRRLAGGVAAEDGAVSAAAGQSAVATGTGAARAPEIAERPGEGDAYRAAYALVRGQEFAAAVDAFSRFLENYPSGRYAPNAHYWLGELYLVVQPPDPEAARQSFMLLLDQYPNNSKIPDALYKLGRVQYMKGNREKSREFLDRVIQEYGSSAAAGLARDFISQNL